VLQGIEALCRNCQVPGRDIDFIMHGTTTVINAMLERKGARTGMLKAGPPPASPADANDAAGWDAHRAATQPLSPPHLAPGSLRRSAPSATTTNADAVQVPKVL
jgi:Hydantoinase/oxoprolinase N-terminal region